MMANNLDSWGLENYAVTSLPASAFYIANFLSIEEEEALLQKIQERSLRDWTELSRRRLQAWPARLSNNALIEKPLPAWLADPCVPRMLSLVRHPKAAEVEPSYKIDSRGQHMFAASPHRRPNHVLINEYRPGQGIMPHEDGPAYFPVVATVSLGAAIVLDIYEKGDAISTKPKFRVLQEPRSLLVTTDDLYKRHLHGIQEVDEDRDLEEATIANWNLLAEGFRWSSRPDSFQECTGAEKAPPPTFGPEWDRYADLSGTDSKYVLPRHTECIFGGPGAYIEMLTGQFELFSGPGKGQTMCDYDEYAE